MKHFLEANYKTVHWGFLSSEIDPALQVSSGDEIEITSVSGPPEVTRNSPFNVKETLLEIHEKSIRGTLQGGHICTGPIAVQGSNPGDVVEIEILAHSPFPTVEHAFIRIKFKSEVGHVEIFSRIIPSSASQ